MGDSNLHARKVLLRQYEAACMAFERPISYKQCFFFAGKLRVIAEVLQECRHTGDSIALKPEEWVKDADQRIVNALKVGFRQRAYKGEPAGFHCEFQRQIFNRNKDQVEDGGVLVWD